MSKIKTHNEFIDKLEKINPNILILSSFQDLTKTKIKCHCKVCGYEWKTLPHLLLKGHGCKICNKKPKGEFKYRIGDKILSEGRNLVIIDREYRQWIHPRTSFASNRKYYKYRCLDCGNEDWIIESRLLDKQSNGCNVCKSNFNRLIQGVNDIATMMPEIATLFKDKDAAKTHSRGSKEEAVFICPDCGRELIKRINSVCKNGLSCPCKDSWSYPNKFIYALLEQLNLDFTPEKVFDWSKDKKYDEYVAYNGKSIIIEMQGKQHYNKPFREDNRHRSVSEEKANDELKHSMALVNGINYYFAIDCQKSEMDYIKGSIISSGLLDILCISITDIDWDKCDKFATSNFTKQVCEYYESHKLSVAEVAKHYKLSRKTIQRYLNKGNKFGWCNYDGKSISLSNIGNREKKAVYCKTIDMIFDSATDAAKYLNLPDAKYQGRSIRNAIKFNRPYLNYTFEYVTQVI